MMTSSIPISLELRRLAFFGTLVLGFAVTPAGSIADTQTGSLVERLMREGEITCLPALRHFCGNIHVGCAGRSRIRATPFVLTLDGDAGRLSYETGTPPSDTARSGHVELAEDLADAIVWLDANGGYIKVEADGRYSFRLYRRGTALMSRGICRTGETS